MNEFEYYASLLGLLMALSLVEVINGAVRAAQSRKKIRLGVLTPLLALFVMLDVTSYWENAWGFRDTVEVNFFTLYVGLFVASAYYYLASRIFPARVEECNFFDDHFMLVRRQVLFGLAIVNLPIIVPLIGRLIEVGRSPFYILLTQGIYFALIVIAATLRDKRVVAGTLGAMCQTYMFWAGLDLAGFKHPDNPSLFWIAYVVTILIGFAGGWTAFLWQDRHPGRAEAVMAPGR